MYFFGFVILMNVRHFNLKRNQEQTALYKLSLDHQMLKIVLGKK